MGFVVDKVAIRFPLQIRIPTIAPQLPSGASTISHPVATVPSGLSLTQPQETKK
jgi:hypothetical protein